MRPNKDKFISECIKYGSELGYELSQADLECIYDTSYDGETIEHAVDDYLDCNER